MTSQQRFTHLTRPEGVAPGPRYSHVVVALARPVFLLKVEALALAGRWPGARFVLTSRPAGRVHGDSTVRASLG
jgi:hypothetical protein